MVDTTRQIFSDGIYPVSLASQEKSLNGKNVPAEDGNDGIMIVNYNETTKNLTDEITLTFDSSKYNKAVCYIGGKKTIVGLIDGKFEIELGVGEGVFVIPYAE